MKKEGPGGSLQFDFLILARSEPKKYVTMHVSKKRTALVTESMSEIKRRKKKMC